MASYGREQRKVFATCPTGQHQAVIASHSFHLNENKEFEGRKYTQDEHWIIFQVDLRIPDDFEDEKVRRMRYEIREKYSDKMGVVPKRKPPKLVEQIADGLLGRRWTDEERYGKPGSDDPNEGRFDFESLVGVNCTIMVAHRQFESGKWAHIAAIVPFISLEDSELLVPEPTIASLFEKDKQDNVPPPSDDDNTPSPSDDDDLPF